MKQFFAAHRLCWGCAALALCLLAAALVLWWVEVLPAQTKGVSAKLNDQYTAYTDPIEESVSQTFSTEQPLYTLGFVFGLSGEQPQGELSLTLTNAATGEVLAVMRQLAQEGMTMLVVTHEMGFARNVSSRTVFMENGVVVEEAPSQEFFAHPKEARTREFLQKISHTE